MFNVRHRTVILVLSALCLLLPQFAARAAPAQEALRALADDALAVLTDEAMDEQSRQQAFRDVLRRGFDVEAVSRFVLGRYWRQASEEERAAFARLFEDYIVTTYAVRLANYRAGMFEVLGARELDRPQHALVQSEIRPSAGPSVRVDWRMHENAGRWRVTDILVEGVSMAVAQRAEFASVIRRDGGVNGLIERLETLTRELRDRRYAGSN